MGNSYGLQPLNTRYYRWFRDERIFQLEKRSIFSTVSIVIAGIDKLLLITINSYGM